MTVVESLRARSGILVGGGLSFVAALAVFRAWSGDPLVQPSGDIGIVIGFAMVALFFVISDTRGSRAR